MILSELVRLFASLFVLITTITGTAHIIVLIFAAIYTTIGRSIFQPGFQAAIPRIFSARGLTKANSIAQIIEETASVMGPLVCSLLLFLAKKSAVLIFDFFTYFISIIVLFNLMNLNSNENNSFNFIKFIEKRLPILNIFLQKINIYLLRSLARRLLFSLLVQF